MTVNNKPRRRGSYSPLSVNYYEDEKIIEAGEKAELLFVRSLAFCGKALSDGFISDVQLSRFVGAGMSALNVRVDALMKAGLWEKVDGGFLVVSWLKWNNSAEEIRKSNELDSQRKRGRKNANGETES